MVDFEKEGLIRTPGDIHQEWLRGQAAKLGAASETPSGKSPLIATVSSELDNSKALSRLR